MKITLAKILGLIMIISICGNIYLGVMFYLSNKNQSELSQQIDSLNGQITGLTEDNSSLTQQIAEMKAETAEETATASDDKEVKDAIDTTPENDSDGTVDEQGAKDKIAEVNDNAEKSGKYVDIQTYDDGLTLGQLPDGSWEVISDTNGDRTQTKDASGKSILGQDKNGDGIDDVSGLPILKPGEGGAYERTPEELQKIEDDAKEIGNIHLQ